MISLDGSQGEGGGQIVRSSLTLAIVTGTPLELRNIRAGRKKPGLQRQHLTAVRAAAEISDAHVEGDNLGSSKLVFHPQQVRAGEFTFRIGTAGSTTLVLQTILPALCLAAGPSQITLEGGTHNPLAPTFDFVERVYLPLFAQMGPRFACELFSHGFFPAGGGRFSVAIHPSSQFGRLELLDRGALETQRARVLLAGLPQHIAERERKVIRADEQWRRAKCDLESIDSSSGPGNVVELQMQFERVTEIVTSFGQRGIRAEKVAKTALNEARRFLRSTAAVGEHLADQLLLPLGIGAHQGTGGGAFRTSCLSSHTTTHVDLLKQFLSIRVDIDQQDSDDFLVQVAPATLE